LNYCSLLTGLAQLFIWANAKLDMETHQLNTQIPSATPSGGENISLACNAPRNPKQVLGVKGASAPVSMKGGKAKMDFEGLKLSEREVTDIERMVDDPLGEVRWM
jgi:hypothetical protein